VASISGDIRRALMLCRRAAELVEAENAGGSDGVELVPRKVGIADVNRAAKELNASHTLQAIAHAPTLEKVWLVATVAQFQATGLDFAAFEDIVPRFATLCSTVCGLSAPSMDESLGICERLASSRLLLLESTPTERCPIVRLNVQQDDVSYALREDEQLSEHLASA